MEEQRRGKGPLIALIIVLALLVLLVTAQYSLKHDLPIAQFLRGKPAQTPAAAVEERPKETPPAGTPAPTEAPVPPAVYGAYVRDTLLPMYGQADAEAVAEALLAAYAFSDGEVPSGVTGLLSANRLDLDGNGTDELVVLLIRQDGDRFPLELRIYGSQNGTIAELPDATAAILEMTELPAEQAGCFELVVQDDARYLLYHAYMEGEDTFYDRYIAYDVTAGKTKLALDGVFSCYDDTLRVAASVLPPWIDANAVKDAPEAADPTDGRAGTLLYAGAALSPAGEGGAEPSEVYTALYSGSLSALNAMLGPLVSTERIALLDPLPSDWSELSALLSGEEITDEETDEFGDYGELDGFEGLDDFAELDGLDDSGDYGEPDGFADSDDSADAGTDE